MEHFLPELLHIVLSKLPVKSLLRLRCVSKLWLSIIDSSYFINLHLAQTAKTCSNTIIVPYNFKEYNKSMPMYAFEFDNKNKARIIEPPVVGYNKRFVHTCNGLISLLTEDSFVIWNPATHKHRVVEKVKVDDNNGGRCIYNGFGYDHKTDDYKVVMFGMQQLKEEKKCLIVYIYSLKTGSWRKLGTTNLDIMGALTLSVYANGAIHWINSNFVVEPIFEMKVSMVAFDLTTEKWLPLTMPPKPSERLRINETWSLSNHHGSLYAGCCDDVAEMVDLWVMNSNQGTKINTWTKLFTIKRNGSFCIKITPLWSLKKTSRHQVLIHEDDELQLYDIEEKTTEAFDVYDVSGSASSVSGIWKSFPCYETLVSI